MMMMGWRDDADADETRARVSVPDCPIALEPHEIIDVCHDDDWNDDDAGRPARWGDGETRARWRTIVLGGRGAQSPWR